MFHINVHTQTFFSCSSMCTVRTFIGFISGVLSYVIPHMARLNGVVGTNKTCVIVRQVWPGNIRTCS